MGAGNILNYTQLSTEIFSPEALEKRLGAMDVVSATGLLIENLSLAMDINEQLVVEHFSKPAYVQRRMIAECLLSPSCFLSQRFIDAFKNTPREVFVRERCRLIGNWADINVIERDCTIETVWLIGFILSLLAPQSDESGLMFGCGTGYSSALAFEMMGQKGSITNIDISDRFLELAKFRLEGLYPENNAMRFVEADVLDYVPARKFDFIWPSLAVKEIPESWVNSLQDGGRICIYSPSELGGGDCVLRVYRKIGPNLDLQAELGGIFNAGFGDDLSDDEEREFMRYKALEDAFVEGLLSSMRPL